MKALRVCVVGCGGIATRQHGPSYVKYVAAHPDTDLVACCDTDEGRAAAFARRFGFGRHYTDLDEMLRRERPDAVCAMVSEAVACRVACRIVGHGYPLLMEKPPGLTVSECDRIAEASARSGAPVQVAFNRRFAPLARELARQIEARGGSAGVQHVHYELVRVRRTESDFSTTAIHGIDAARFLAQSDYAEVRFRYQPLPELGDGVVSAFMDCVFTSGATASLSFCPCAGAVLERAVVHGRDVTWLLHSPVGGVDGSGRLVRVERGEVCAEMQGAAEGDDAADFVRMGFYAENERFFDDVRAGRRPACGLAHARQSVAVAEQMRMRAPVYRA